MTVSSERKPQVTSLPSWSKHGQLPKLGCHDNIRKGGVLRKKEREKERVAACSYATEHERQKQLNGDRHLDQIWCPSVYRMCGQTHEDDKQIIKYGTADTND